MTEKSLAFSTQVLYDSTINNPINKAGAGGSGKAIPHPNHFLAKGEIMATPNCNGKQLDSATPRLYEDHQKIVTLPAMARHVSRATLLRLITHLQADRPASARVHSANVGDDGDGAR